MQNFLYFLLEQSSQLLRIWLITNNSLDSLALGHLILATMVTWGGKTPSLCHVWGWYALWTTSYIHIRHIKSVWAIGMLSQGHMGAPLYPTTSQVGPRFGDSRCLWSVKMVPLRHSWVWYPPQTATHILISHTQSVYAIGMMSQENMGAPLYRYAGQNGPRFVKLRSLVEWKWCHYVMSETDIDLRPLHTSLFDIYKVFEPLVCCLKGMWVHPYTITLARLAQDLGIQVHLWSENDVLTSWLRLLFPWDHFIHPY